MFLCFFTAGMLLAVWMLSNFIAISSQHVKDPYCYISIYQVILMLMLSLIPRIQPEKFRYLVANTDLFFCKIDLSKQNFHIAIQDLVLAAASNKYSGYFL